MIESRVGFVGKRSEVVSGKNTIFYSICFYLSENNKNLFVFRSLYPSLKVKNLNKFKIFSN